MALGGPVRINTSTLNAWIKEEISPIFRKSVILGMLQAKKRIKYNCGGDKVAWNVRYLRRGVNKITGAVTSTSFPNVSTKLPMLLDWAAYDMGESVTKLERLKNQGSDVKIYDLIQSVLAELLPDFIESWRMKLWQDGSQAADELMGLLSLFGGSSTPNSEGTYNNAGTYTASTGKDGTSPWWCCTPNNSVTYAGVSTALGAKVNDYTNPDTAQNYPLGQFSSGYNFNSPLYIDYNNKEMTPNPQLYVDGATTPVHCWESQWQQSCSRLAHWLGVLQSRTVDMVVLDPDLFMRAQDSMISGQRFAVNGSSEARAVGINDFEFQGMSFAYEYGVPSGMGFAIPWDMLEYRCMQGQLVERAEDNDIVTSENLYKYDTYGQLVCKAAGYFGALVPATAAGT